MTTTPDRYPTTRSVTCECSWRYSVTNGVPAECPMCVHKRGKAELERVLRDNSDLKGKTNEQ